MQWKVDKWKVIESKKKSWNRIATEKTQQNEDKKKQWKVINDRKFSSDGGSLIRLYTVTRYTYTYTHVNKYYL